MNDLDTLHPSPLQEHQRALYLTGMSQLDRGLYRGDLAVQARILRTVTDLIATTGEHAASAYLLWVSRQNALIHPKD